MQVDGQDRAADGVDDIKDVNDIDGIDDERSAHAVRGWALVVWFFAFVGWLLELAAVGFSKPAHNDNDPRSAAAANHQINVAWAQHISWMILAFLGAALLGALAAGRRPVHERILAAGIGALGSAVAIFVVALYDAIANYRFVF